MSLPAPPEQQQTPTMVMESYEEPEISSETKTDSNGAAIRFERRITAAAGESVTAPPPAKDDSVNPDGGELGLGPGAAERRDEEEEEHPEDLLTAEEPKIETVAPANEDLEPEAAKPPPKQKTGTVMFRDIPSPLDPRISYDLRYSDPREWEKEQTFQSMGLKACLPFFRPVAPSH